MTAADPFDEDGATALPACEGDPFVECGGVDWSLLGLRRRAAAAPALWRTIGCSGCSEVAGARDSSQAEDGGGCSHDTEGASITQR